MKKTRLTVVALAAGALLALPATGLAAPGGQGKSQGKAKSCANAPKVGFQISGALVSLSQDDPGTTGVVEPSAVELTITAANRHARHAFASLDTDADRKGVQLKGAPWELSSADDAFTLELNGYEGDDTPSAGDKVKVSGRVPVTKKRCAAQNASLADRYGKPDVRKVTISDRDEDVVAPV